MSEMSDPKLALAASYQLNLFVCLYNCLCTRISVEISSVLMGIYLSPFVSRW